MDEKPPIDVPLLPGAAADERKRRKGKSRGNFTPFPRYKTAHGYTLDRKKIKAEYFESQVVDWSAYCETRGYNPEVDNFPWRQWVREKRYLNAWNGVKSELEVEGANIGPRRLLNALRAVKNVPEVSYGMLQLCHHAIAIHADEVRADNALIQERQRNRQAVQKNELIFSATPNDLVALSSALRTAKEVLFSSLGIDQALGLNVDHWMQTVEEKCSQLETVSEADKEHSSGLEVEVIGAEDALSAMKEAVEEYVDKPGQTHLTTDDETSE